MYMCVYVYETRERKRSEQTRVNIGRVTDFTGYSPKNNRFQAEWNRASGENVESPFNGVTPLKPQ